MTSRANGAYLLAYKSGGGIPPVIGLPAALFGGIGIAVVLGGEFPVPVALVPGFFLLVGIVVMAWRTGTTIDVAERRITTWWGLLGPFRSRTRSSAEFDAVSLTEEPGTEGGRSYSVYLSGSSGSVKVLQPEDYAAGRRVAKVIAESLGLGIRDTAAGRVAESEPGALGESFGERTLRLGDLRTGERPPGARTELSSSGDDWILDIPKVTGASFRVVLSLADMTVESTTWVGRFVTRIPYGELVDVGVVPAKLVTRNIEIGPSANAHLVLLRSERERVELARGLEESELQWIVSLIGKAAVDHASDFDKDNPRAETSR